jgi:hypothetical protein
MKTPITDAAEFQATTERPSKGDYELYVVDSEVARGLERKLNEAKTALKQLADAAAISDTNAKQLGIHDEWVAALIIADGE